MDRIACSNLWMRFGGFAALRGIDLSLPAGQYAILVGLNGAGKSTLLKALGGWIRPSDGAVAIDGLAFERAERRLRARVKLVPDTPAFYPELTAWEHLQVVAQAHGLERWQSEAERLLSAFSMAPHQGAYPASLSRGMQYKLALAMSLLAAPSALLLDEPYGALDPASQLYLAERLTLLARAGATVLASTHLLPPTHPPDRILMLMAGTLQRDALLDEVWSGSAEGLAALPHQLLVSGSAVDA